MSLMFVNLKVIVSLLDQMDSHSIKKEVMNENDEVDINVSG